MTQTSTTELSGAAMVNQCLRKKKFRTWAAAHVRAIKHNREHPPPPGYIFHAYSCPLCFGWHVGRTKTKKGSL